MENKVLKRIVLNEKTDDGDCRVSFNNNIITIETFGNVITITDKHDQDCCERVYAELDVINYHLRELKSLYNVREIEIKQVDSMGFLLCFNDEKKILIPCYNEQNGNYTDNLSLIITINGRQEFVDISDCTIDNIN